MRRPRRVNVVSSDDVTRRRATTPHESIAQRDGVVIIVGRPLYADSEEQRSGTTRCAVALALDSRTQI